MAAFWAVALVAGLLLGQVSARAETAQAAGISDAQCVACHDREPQIIAQTGGLHKTAVGCQDCHTEHPPKGTNAIPQCSMCHSGKPHYELADCNTCHSEVHAPMDLTITGSVTEPCLTCHPAQGQELQANPSVHTDLACNECHTKHREIPPCMNCHAKHTEDQDFNACVSCHPVHMPLKVSYKSDTPDRYCTVCHPVPGEQLAANTTKHHDLTCVFCHRDQHKALPPCYACHGKPHPDAMLKKFQSCGDCHSTAHALEGA
jgi:hypothetical protein